MKGFSSYKVSGGEGRSLVDLEKPFKEAMLDCKEICRGKNVLELPQEPKGFGFFKE